MPNLAVGKIVLLGLAIIMSKKRDRSILLTGASGLIGSHLATKLIQDYELITLSRCIGQFNRHFPIDLGTDWSTANLPDHTEFVIHLAQSASFREFPKMAMDIFNVNVATTQKLLDYSIRVGARKFVLASSGGIYGYGDKAFREDTPIKTRGSLGYYLGTKMCMEVLAENYSNYMDVIILRFFFVYGPGQKRTMLIPRLVDSVRKAYPIHLQGNDGIRLNPTHVDDAAAALAASLNLRGSHKINIAGPEVLSLREIGEKIGKVVSRKPDFVVDSREDPNHLIGDISKMSKLLGCPKIQFSDGVLTILDR